jgi:hypothetical protein
MTRKHKSGSKTEIKSPMADIEITESDVEITDADFQKMIEVITKARRSRHVDPKLARTLKNDLLSVNLNSKIDEKRQGSNMLNTVATALSGGASLGLLAAAIIPNIPSLAAIGVVVGLLGSNFAGSKIDQLLDKNH